MKTTKTIKDGDGFDLYGVKLFAKKGIPKNEIWVMDGLTLKKKIKIIYTPSIKKIKEKILNIGGEWRLNFNKAPIYDPQFDINKKNELIGFEKGIVWYQQKIKEIFK